MKKVLLLISVVLLFEACAKDKNGTAGRPVYYTFNGQIGANDNSTLVSADNYLIICGNSGGNISILKISKTGTQIWRKDFAAGNMSSASGIAATGSQDLFICGETFRNYSRSMSDILLIKTNSTGDTLWTKTYGGAESEYGANIIATSDGNVLIAGKTESFGAGSMGDIYLLKVNPNGDTLWTRSYPDPDQEVPFHVLETQNGEFLVTGTNEDGDSPRKLYLLKVDADGNQLWKKDAGAAWGYCSIELPNGDLLSCGKQTIAGFSQVFLIKTDHLGNMIWEKEFGENHLSEQGNSIKQNPDGTCTLTGSSYDIETAQDNIIIIKVDENGNQLWSIIFGSPATDWGMNLIKDNDGDNIITGDYNDLIFMTRMDDDGNFKQ